MGPVKLRAGCRGSAMRPGGVSVDNASGMAALRSERSLDRRCFSEWGGIAAGRCFGRRCFYRSGVSGETGMRLGGGSDGPFRLERCMRPGTFRPGVRARKRGPVGTAMEGAGEGAGRRAGGHETRRPRLDRDAADTVCVSRLFGNDRLRGANACAGAAVDALVGVDDINVAPRPGIRRCRCRMLRMRR